MSYTSEDMASADNTTRSQSRSHSLDGTRSGDSSESRRESLLLSDEQYIVDYLGNSSGSDDGMSIEAQRITRRKKLEREKLQKLGLFTTFLIVIRDRRTAWPGLVQVGPRFSTETSRIEPISLRTDQFYSEDNLVTQKRKTYSVGYTH